jgi:DNA-binding NarL/FixJ family response regulator
MNEQKIRILIVDDQNMYLESIKIALEMQPGFSIIGTAKNGLEAYQRINDYLPDILLMDISMPEMDGIDASELILKEYPNQKIILVSTFANRSFISKAVQIGVKGYVLKDEGLFELVSAIKSVMNKGQYFSPMVYQTLADLYKTKEYTGKSPNLQRLSETELKVLRDWALGSMIKESAEKFFISQSAIEKHRQNIKKKFNLVTPSDVTLFALKEGLIRTEDIPEFPVPEQNNEPE